MRKIGLIIPDARQLAKEMSKRCWKQPMPKEMYKAIEEFPVGTRVMIRYSFRGEQFKKAVIIGYNGEMGCTWEPVAILKVDGSALLTTCSTGWLEKI